LEEELPKRDMGVVVVKFGSVRHLPKLLRHVVYFFKILKLGWEVDIIFAQDPVSVGLPSCLAAWLMRKHFFLKVVGDYAWEQYYQRLALVNREPVLIEEFQGKKYDFVTELRRMVQRKVAKYAEKIIVPSEFLKKIISQWGVSKDKITVVYNSFEEPSVRVGKEEARSKLGISGKAVVSVGRLVPWKGFRALIEIMPGLLEKFSDMTLFIIGQGPELNNLRLTARELGLKDRVIFTGRLDRELLFRYIVAANVFVLNTGYEGLSHQILEVMSLGTPVITTFTGGNTEIIKDGREGMLVPYNNKELLKRAIMRVLLNPEYAGQLAGNARDSLSRFSREKMISRLIGELTRIR
jgi:glycosyltransferase involved in cell wall biosynthesis